MWKYAKKYFAHRYIGQMHSWSLMLFLVFLSVLANAESCQFITGLSKTHLPVITSYRFREQLPAPYFASSLPTVSDPGLITVSENNKFVIVTDSETAEARVYSVSPLCELTDTKFILHGVSNTRPTMVLQQARYMYVLIPSQEQIQVFNFNSSTGKITPSDVRTIKFDPKTILTSIAYYHVPGDKHSDDPVILYVAREGGITVLRLVKNPDTVVGGYIFEYVRSFELGYTPGQMQIVGKVLFVLKPALLELEQLDNLFVASYELQDGKFEKMGEFKVAEGEHPINFLATYTPFSIDYLPPGLTPFYLLFITSGNKLYTYDLYSNGQIVPGSLVGKRPMPYYTLAIASTWNARLTELEKLMTGSYFRVSLIEPLGMNYPANNRQTVVMQKNKDTSQNLDWVMDFHTEELYRQYNMVIAPQPRE